jgi:pyroglutamyl-peptidase
MPFTILITGFGPFPGAPLNPTGPLVKILVRRYRAAGVHCMAHIFRTSYEAVDRELPMLVERERPAVIVMFGLSQQARHLRIETHARNVRSRIHADVAGLLPSTGIIAPGGPDMLALRAPAHQLVAAARGAGVRATLSRDAGSYLCNYLCWRASEAASEPEGPRLVAFVHVPNVRPLAFPSARPGDFPFTLGDLARAGEAIVKAAHTAARTRR